MLSEAIVLYTDHIHNGLEESGYYEQDTPTLISDQVGGGRSIHYIQVFNKDDFVHLFCNILVKTIILSFKIKIVYKYRGNHKA